MDEVPIENPLAWYANIGGDISQDGHGDVNLGLMKGPWSLQLQTDTLDVRWSPEGEHGRAWVGLRGAAFAAQMVITPWTGGAPDPARGFNGRYVGIDAGVLRYLPAGFYAGPMITARAYDFAAQPLTTAPVPDGRVVTTPELQVGWWHEHAQVLLVGGLDVAPTFASPTALSPHLYVYARGEIPSTIISYTELRAGIADNQDFLVRTRLGGLNPYVVPLAGAAWAEFWVEDYAALRTGLLAPIGEHVRTGPLVDGVVMTEVYQGEAQDITAGLGWMNRVEVRKFRGQLDVGWSPWLERQPGYGAWSVWLRLERGWGMFGG